LICFFLKVSKFQKHFFLKLHCPKNERNLRQNSALLQSLWHKGPYFNYVSTFLSIFDQVSTLVSIFTTVPDNSYSTVVSILQTKYVPLCANVIKVWPLRQNFVKYVVHFLGNGVSRKNAFEIYWPLKRIAIKLKISSEINPPLRKLEIVRLIVKDFFFTTENSDLIVYFKLLCF